MADYKLTAELVPKPCWFKSMAGNLRPSVWDRIRREVYDKHKRQCGICEADCSARGAMICHEIWEYDDDNRIQRLAGLIGICRKCDSVKHFGRLGPDFLDDVAQQFMTVNDCSREEFDRYFDESFNKWTQRSVYEDWKTDWGEYEYLKTPQYLKPNSILL